MNATARGVFAGALVATLTAAYPGAATAQSGAEPSPAALVAARELFRDAAADVDAGRFDVALGKFRRVAEVKETAAVRFNIGRCEEQLGLLGAALADYEFAIREAAGDPKVADAGKMAQERANALRPRVPRLTVAPPAKAPPDMIVKLDGERQPTGTLGVALPVNPGHHRVDATSGSATFTKEVTLREGEAQSVTVDFPPPKPRYVPDEVARRPAPPPPPPPAPTPNRVPGYIVLGVGGVLGVASFAFLLLHNQASDDLTKQKATDCTLRGGACPDTASTKLLSLQSDARRDEGLAIGFFAGSVVALGVGAYLTIFPSRPKASTPSARLVPAPGGALLVGAF